MSEEYERDTNDWKDTEGEVETPSTWRDAYPDAVPQKRPRRHPENVPPEMPRRPGTRALPRGVPGSAYTYEEHDEADEQEARRSRQAHKDALARLRRRPHQPIYARTQEEPPTRTPPASRQSRAPQPQNEEYPSRPASPRRERPGASPTRPVRPERAASDFAASQRAVDPYQPFAEDDDELYPSAARDRPREQGFARARDDDAYRRRDYRDPRYEDEDEYDVRATPSTRRERGRSRHEDEYGDATRYNRYTRGRQQRRRGRAGSHIFAGCLGALLTIIVIVAVAAFYLLHNTPLGQTFGKTAYKQSSSQPISLVGVGELIVKNQVGNITIGVASGNSSGLTSTRTVYASNSSDADTLLSKMTVSMKQIAQGADPTCITSACLLVSATLPPNTTSGLFGNTISSMDLRLTLPSSFNTPDPTAPHVISASDKSGNISIDGFNGVFNLTGESGSINVTHSLIFAGTCIQTMQGDITINTGSLFDLTQSSNRVPCSATTSSGEHPWFSVTSGRGNDTIALSAPSTDLLLDANTNNGKISNDFGLNIPGTSDGSASYHGPLLPNSTPTASLYVFTSTGNIAIRKA